MALSVPHEQQPEAYLERMRTPGQMFVRRFVRNRLAVFGLVLVVIMVAAAVFAPHLAPMNPYIGYSDGTTAQGLPLPPTWNWHHFFLGTDANGRDVMSQLLYGTQVSMEVGVMATLISIVIGTFIGLVSGYLGGFWDNILMRLTDLMLAFPVFLFIILVRSLMTNPTVATVYLAIGVLSWAPTARLARGQALAARKLDYVEAARSVGTGVPRTLWRHLLPNIISPVLVYSTLSIASNIILESALSFLGVGVPDPTISWGKMINLGLSWYQTDPLLIIWPGIAIALATLGFNLVGDGLNDAFNVRSDS